MISGTTTLIAHLGYPTFAFKAPLIYNPWFEKNGIDAVVGMAVNPAKAVLDARTNLNDRENSMADFPQNPHSLLRTGHLEPKSTALRHSFCSADHNREACVGLRAVDGAQTHLQVAIKPSVL